MTERMPYESMARTEVTWMPWCNLGDLRLVHGDIGKAIIAFREKTKKEARVILLNPKNEELAGEADGSIQVGYYSCVLLWEVWVSENPTVDLVTPRSVMKNVETHCNKTATRPKTPVGRPRAEFPVEKALELEALGLGLREIAEGLGVSHMTVARRLRKAKEGATN